MIVGQISIGFLISIVDAIKKEKEVRHDVMSHVYAYG